MPELVSATCPNCGAAFQLDPSGAWAQCQYCGTQSYVQKPQGPPPPPNSMVIMLNVPGAIPMQVNMMPGAAPPPGTPLPPHINPNDPVAVQAAREAQARVAAAQGYSAAQMSSAYMQMGNSINQGIKWSLWITLIAVAVPIVIVFIVLFVAFGVFMFA